MKLRSVVKYIAATTLPLAFTTAHASLSDIINNASQQLACYTLDCAHWYVSGNIGMSHLYDSRSPGTGNSMNENGPGWNVDGGYQFNSLLGGELGYTQYHDSRETFGSTNIAKTEHYAVHVAATGRYPLVNKWSMLGKLGAAYSYANKIFTASGASGSSGAVSPYLGLGFAYSLTPKVDFVAQWAGVRGNDYTGSSTLYSLGLIAAIV